jgi:putative transposase
MAQLEDMRLPAAAREALVDDPSFLRELVEAALNRFLDAEISEHLQAGPYERSAARTGYRNGYRSRQLKTRVGTLQLLVPMDREGTFRTELFDRFQRSEKALVGTLMEMYLGGVSTRKVRDVTEALCGTSFGKSTVSRLVGELDTDLVAWRERRLEVAYPYLVVDARYEHVRVHGQVVSQGVLIVKGVREDGLRELLAVEVADTESEATYDELFGRLKDRGLTGVRLLTSDDHRGLVKAIQKHFQGASWQRCQVHIAHNALGKVGRKYQKALSEDIRAVFNAPTLPWAHELKGEVVERWSRSHPKVAEWLETALEDGLACFA